MYTKGIKMMENKDRLMVQAQVFRDHQEIKSCSFKPALVTKKSRWGKIEEHRRSQSVMDGQAAPPRFQELYERNRSKQQKLE